MWFIGLIFVVVGIGLVVGSIAAVSRTKRFLATAQETRAEIVGMEMRSGTNSSRTYYPILRYKTRTGATQEVVSSVGSNPPRYKEGESVPVLYDPAQPTNVRIHSLANVWILPMVLGGIGVIFIITGGVLAAVMR